MSAMSELSVEALSVWAGGVRLVDGATFSARSGELIAIIGPNGAGKSSLLRAVIGLGDTVSGTALLDGVSLHDMRPRERAKAIAYLPQSHPLGWPIRVADAVALGRFAHGSSHGVMSGRDQAAVHKAMVDCDLVGFAERPITSLSGGELARVHIARVFASEASALLVDEPVAALDPYHALVVMQLLRARADARAAVVAVLHDLALAARFASRIIGMRGGRICMDGTPAQVVTPENIALLFDVEASVDDRAGWPQPTILSALTPEGGQRY